MKLIDDAGVILRKAWSVRLLILAGALSGIEVGLPYIAPEFPPMVAAVATALVTLAALVARFVAQPKMHAEADK